MITIIVLTFVIGYLFIALEGTLKINKAAIAVLMCVACWTLYALGGFTPSTDELNDDVMFSLGETSTTLFFLLGAMAIVEVVDLHGGFNFVRTLLRSSSKRALLWKVGCITFLLSSVLDDLTTSIVMMMMTSKLVSDAKDRMWYASIIVIAADTGGAFSPIGDITTVMLWNSHMLSAVGVLRDNFVPSVLAFLVPLCCVQFHLNGPVDSTALTEDTSNGITPLQRNTIFLVGVIGLCTVPIFHSLTTLPAFVGTLLVLGILWVMTEIMYKTRNENTPLRLTRILEKMDVSTVLFFLGILMSVSVLSHVGVLTQLGQWFSDHVGNNYLITGCIGIVSSVVDNVPLVAGAMKMYAIDPAGGPLGMDGVFWEMLAYCAGTGGALLIIGSAAGVVIMGMQKISFSWYLRHITPYAFLGYIAGIIGYWLLHM